VAQQPAPAAQQDALPTFSDVAPSAAVFFTESVLALSQQAAPLEQQAPFDAQQAVALLFCATFLLEFAQQDMPDAQQLPLAAQQDFAAAFALARLWPVLCIGQAAEPGLQLSVGTQTFSPLSLCCGAGLPAEATVARLKTRLKVIKIAFKVFITENLLNKLGN
jgi:hypothetical protein